MQPDISLDPAIRLLADRRHVLADRVAQLGAILTAYAAHTLAAEDRVAISPLEHYSMLDSPDCGCDTCADWEQRRVEFVEAANLVPKGHRWTICGCPDCRFVGRIQLNYLAATNRRDLLIEMSFHARYHSRHGSLIMAWLARELQNPTYTINWCAQEMSRYPLERWINRCEMAVSGVISGAVFLAAAGVTDYTAHLGSSLNAYVGGSDYGMEDS